MTPTITLLTDFGDRDGFVGAMKGVMLRENAALRFIDIAHQVPQGDVVKAARVWARAALCFPPGTIHLGVVDPGVGSQRKGLAARIGDYTFVAPDNGLISGVAWAGASSIEVHTLSPSALGLGTLSSTFHGRDLFAPTAARLASGLPLAKVGPRTEHWVRLETPAFSQVDGVWIGEVVEIDQFGNALTNLPATLASAPLELSVRAWCLKGPQTCYSAVAADTPVLVVGSLGTLEVAVRNGSAARVGAIQVGDEVRCRPLQGPAT